MVSSIVQSLEVLGNNEGKIIFITNYWTARFEERILLVKAINVLHINASNMKSCIHYLEPLLYPGFRNWMSKVENCKFLGHPTFSSETTVY